MAMNEMWSYDKVQRIGDDGRRWHFVTRYTFEGEEPRESYFRDNDRSEYGMIRFDRVKDFPYRDYETFVRKVMNNSEFRSKYLDANTADIWNRNWK